MCEMREWLYGYQSQKPRCAPCSSTATTMSWVGAKVSWITWKIASSPQLPRPRKPATTSVGRAGAGAAARATPTAESVVGSTPSGTHSQTACVRSNT